MKNKIIISVLALLAAIFGYTTFSGNGIGGTTNFSDLSVDSLAVSGTSALTGATTVTGDASVSGGTFNITTSNTATSTLVAGCWEFYATSTVTALKYQATTTPGLMFSTYGACPRL